MPEEIIDRFSHPKLNQIHESIIAPTALSSRSLKNLIIYNNNNNIMTALSRFPSGHLLSVDWIWPLMTRQTGICGREYWLSDAVHFSWYQTFSSCVNSRLCSSGIHSMTTFSVFIDQAVRARGLINR